MGGTTDTKQAKSVSTNEPWAEQRPYLLQGFEEAQNLWNANGPEYFPGSTVAGFSPEQLQAGGMITQRAMEGSPLNGASSDFIQSILNGDYLNSNPYGDDVFANIQSKVQPAVDSRAMMSGRLGSNLHADTLTRALTEAYAPWASQNYQFGLDKMMDAAKYAPELAKNDYFDASVLENWGKQRRDLAQSELTDATSRWDFYQQQPYNKLSDYMGIVGGTNWGGTSTTKSPYQVPSTFGSILGIGSSLLGGLMGGGIF